MPLPMRVVLLRDGSWPHLPGGCCWRHSVRWAFGAAGAEVVELSCRVDPPPPPSRSQRQRMAWLPRPARRPLAGAHRRARAVAGTLRTRSRDRAIARHHRAELAPALAGAALVVAESPAAAAIAAGLGVPRVRLWALALPAERLFAGDRSGEAGVLAGAAPLVGGFLAASEPDRASVERAAASHPTRVVLFPPVAADRTCPSCLPAPPPEVESGPPSPQARSAPAPPPLRSGPAELLARWRGPAGVQQRAARALLAAVAPQQPARPRPARPVLVAGYDLKFATDLAEQLDRRTDLAVTVDDWPDLGRPTRHTRQRLAQAQAIFAEWARTSAVWLSQRKRPDQLLVVRLHRFELDSSYPRQLALDSVDAMVYIAPLFGRRIRDELGWPAEKLVYIPNFLDVAWFDRPKLPEARFAIGFVGMEWSRKRFDLALDLLAALRREDLRFTLVVRSAMPWENGFAWADPAERAYVGRCFERLDQDRLLRDAVTFDPPGRDMARWYRRVGHLASTSDEEGSHASVAEAMAAGTVPVVRAWPGAGEIYDKEWVHTSTEEAAAAVLAATDAKVWADRAVRAQTEIRRTHDPAAVVAAWADLLHGDLPAARRHFAEQAPDLGEA